MKKSVVHKQQKGLTKSESLWKRCSDYVCYIYFHYTLVTTIAMLEPNERYIFNVLFVLLVSLIVYTSVMYLPGHVMMLFWFFLHITGISPYPSIQKLKYKGLGKWRELFSIQV